MKYSLYLFLIVSIVLGGLSLISEQALGAEQVELNAGDLDTQFMRDCVAEAQSMVSLYHELSEDVDKTVEFANLMVAACIYMEANQADYSAFIEYMYVNYDIRLPYKEDLEKAVKRKRHDRGEYRL